MDDTLRPNVLLIAPGSGTSGKALEASRACQVYLAANPLYDQPGRRYPPGWACMHGVMLDEDDAEAAGIDSMQIGFGRASPQNLATWPKTFYDSEQRTVTCLNLSGPEIEDIFCAAADSSDPTLGNDAIEYMHPVTEASLACIVCGSRGGQVTLPALWLLGCRLPCVVINGGCCRSDVVWTWPAGVPIVLVTGGRCFFNEHMLAPGLWDLESDLAYRKELWSTVPVANRATTAVLHLPRAGHIMEEEVLRVLLPAAIQYAASKLDESKKPDGRGLPEDEPLMLITEYSPVGGELVCGELIDAPPPALPATHSTGDGSKLDRDVSGSSEPAHALVACLRPCLQIQRTEHTAAAREPQHRTSERRLSRELV